jgi:oligopeptide transport system substrate-binding protein
VVERCGDAWAEAENIVTNGPFRLESWDQQLITLSRNPDYHGRSQGNVARVVLFSHDEWSARLERYEDDKLDILALWDLLGTRDRARQRHADEYLSGPHMATLSVGFNTRSSPFDDIRVRSAFVHAVDRETLADVVRHGYEFPAMGGFLPPGTPGYAAGIGLAYDPKRARGLLAEAGYPEGENFPSVTFLADQGRESLCDYLQAQWQRNLGVEIPWETLEWDGFMTRQDEDPPGIYLFSWAADYPDPHSFLGACTGVQWTGWRHQGYEQLVEQARQMMDQEKRLQFYRQADKLLVQEAAVMPFTYGRIHMIIKPWVTRFPTSATRWWHWKDVIVEPH